jgi:hypothetical protein
MHLEHSNSIRHCGVKQQLLLGSKGTVNETLRQTLELKIAKLAVRSSTRLRKTSVRTLWRGWLPPKWKKRLPTAYALATFRGSVPTNQKNKWQHTY